MIAADKLKQAYTYANRLRNKAKRQYANAYISWLRNGAVGYEPERPRSLSAMGAQAVRLELRDMKLWG